MTTTNATPIRITAEHYQIESQSAQRAGKVYDLFFNRDTRRWECSCPDANPAKGNNPNCKHRRRLVAWITEQETSSRVQREATAIVSPPSLIEEQLAGLELALGQQAEMIRDLQELVSILQVQQCKTNEHRFQLDDKVNALQAGNDALVYEVLRLQTARHGKGDVTQETSEAHGDRVAWEEFEKDPEAGRARQGAKRREAALNRGNEGFSILKK